MIEKRAQDDRAAKKPANKPVVDSELTEETAKDAEGPLKPLDNWPKDDPINPEGPLKPLDNWPKDEPVKSGD